jgi:glutathione S-transferase
MEIALYYAPNTCALAPYVTLTEAGADFEVRPLNYRKRQNFSPEYLKINPKHKVPALVVDGKILTENVAIHQWVHQTFPYAKILPADPWTSCRRSRCTPGVPAAFILISAGSTIRTKSAVQPAPPTA